MKMRLFISGNILVLFFLSGLHSCKELDYENEFTAFGEVYFDASNVATYSTLKLKYNGLPMDWSNNRRIRIPEGEALFEFYNSNNEEVLAEKTVNVVAGVPETYQLFQPSTNDPIAFLDPNGQANEAAPPEGFMKLKIANYAGDLIPYDELDVIVVGLNRSMQHTHLDTLELVSRNLGDEEYWLVPVGENDILAYTFKFMDKNTKTVLQNIGGTDYWNQRNFFQPSRLRPAPVKRIYTVYLSPFQQAREVANYLKLGDSFYDIYPDVLFHD